MPRNTASNSRVRSLERDVAADLDVQAKFDAHAFHDFAALLDHVLFELERRDAEGQQSADLRVAVEHHGRDAVAHQDVGAGEARGTRADDRDALAGAHDVRQVGLPAQPEGLVGDVFLDRADAHGAQAVVQRAGALAQPVLRTDASAHLRQRIGLMRELRRLEQLALVDQRQPVRNVVVDRAFPLAERVAAGQAAAGLLRGGLGAVLRIDFAKFPDAHFDRELVRIVARNFEKLQVFVGHAAAAPKVRRQAARRRLTSSESIAAAFGFTTQNRPM